MREVVEGGIGGDALEVVRLQDHADLGTAFNGDRLTGNRGNVRKHLGHSRVPAKAERARDEGVLPLYPGELFEHRLVIKVLRQHGKAAAASERCGHAFARHRVHVAGDERDAHAGFIGRRKVDVESRTDVRARGHEEDVGIGEVMLGHLAVELHTTKPNLSHKCAWGLM